MSPHTGGERSIVAFIRDRLNEDEAAAVMAGGAHGSPSVSKILAVPAMASEWVDHPDYDQEWAQ